MFSFFANLSLIKAWIPAITESANMGRGQLKPFINCRYTNEHIKGPEAVLY